MPGHCDYFEGGAPIDKLLVPDLRMSCRDLTIYEYQDSRPNNACQHYSDVIMGAMASQITSLTIAYSTVYSGADQRKHQSSASSAFVQGIHWSPVNSPHKWPVTRKMFPLDDVIMRPMPFWLIRYLPDPNQTRWTGGMSQWRDVSMELLQHTQRHSCHYSRHCKQWI